jgi:glucose-1-phosphate adenylyltransferase
MDYSKMLSFHKEKNAECTIAVRTVPIEEASRMGIMSTDNTDRITEFEEKPKVPKSNLASMGVYIFKKDELVSQLKRDEADENSVNDFGKNIIPYMLEKGKRMFAYSFSGYWKDVGTVTSLWEANMDLLGNDPAISLNAPEMKIYSRNEPLPPAYVGESAYINNSIYTAGCEIYGEVSNSVISEDVYIGKNSVVSNSVIMRGTKIGDNVVINYGMIDENVKIEDGAVIGDENSDKYNIALVGRNQTIAKNSKIKSGEVIESL